MKKSFGVLIDLSGTIHIGDKIIGNSLNGIKRLSEKKLPYLFVSNTTKESRRSLLNRLSNSGLKIPNEKVFTSLTATANYLREQELRPYCLLTDNALDEFQDISKDDPNCVVIGLAPEKFSYKEIDEAFKYILKGCRLIAAHKAQFYRANDGVLRLGPGPFISALEYAGSTEATLIGKPSRNFFENAMKNLGNPEVVYMIGDDVKDDIDGAQNINIRGILVKTGKYQEGDEETINPRPFRVVSSFEEAIEVITAEHDL